MSARWCKKCKLVFHESTCPAGHANFMYTTKIPDAVCAPVPAAVLHGGAGGTPAPAPAPALAPDAAAPPEAVPHVRRLRQASEAERLQTEAVLAAARQVREEEAAIDAELSRVEAETKKHWEVKTGGGLWGKAGGGFAARETGEARELDGVTSRGVTAGTQVAEKKHDFYQPLHRTLLAAGKTKDTWTFGLWPPHSDDSPGQTVQGRVVTFHEHHVVQQGKAKGYLRNHKTAEQAREYLAIVLEVTECESYAALSKMLGLPAGLPAGQYEFWADKGAARDLMNGDLIQCNTLGGTVCIGTSLQLVERAQKPKKHDVVLTVDPMRRGRVYQSEAKDVRYAYSALGTIRDEEAMDSSVLDGSTGFIDQMSATASQQRAAQEAEGRRRQESAAFSASAGDCVSDDEWDD